MRYSLTISRYNRYLKFDTLDELKTELSDYFTKSEIANGIIDRLTTFRKPTATDIENGYVKNDWRDFTVRCYFD